MKHLLPLVSIFLFGTLVHAQWYFESAVISSHQGSHELENMRGGTATTTKLNAYKGFRDQSLGLGYLFSFRSLEQRMAQDYKPPLMRLGMGIGFEQMNLKTNAVINEVAHPNVYSMAQAHGRLGLYLAPALLYAEKQTPMEIANLGCCSTCTAALASTTTPVQPNTTATP